MTTMTLRQRYAIRDKHLDTCRSKAIAMMNLPLGQQAIEGGFYTEMFALSAGQARMIDGMREEIRRLGLIATDMETATLLTAGRVLGARAASLCLGTVDGLTQEKIAADELETREREMFEIALDAIVASLPRAAPGEAQ